MKRSLLAVAFVIGAVLSPAPRPAFGDENPTSKAEALFKEALALTEKYKTSGDARELEDASRKFLAAYRIHPSPNILFNAAFTEEKLDHSADAMHHFRQLLRDQGTDIQLAAQVSKHLTALAPKIATIDVQAPAGADISVDGTSTGDTAPLPDPVDLMPGKHTIEARLGGSASIQIDAIAGTRQTVRIDFATPPSASVPLPAPASAQPAAPVPPSASPLPEPEQAVDVTQEGPRPFWSTRRKVAIAVAGAGVASLVLGVVFEAQSGSDKSQADSIGAKLGSSDCSAAMPPAACASLNDAYSAQDRDQTLGRVFLGVGAVSVVVGATLLLWPDSSRTAHTALVPFTVPQGGGLQLQGDM